MQSVGYNCPVGFKWWCLLAVMVAALGLSLYYAMPVMFRVVTGLGLAGTVLVAIIVYLGQPRR